MPLSPDIVNSVTIIEQASPALPGFGIPIIGVLLNAGQITAWDATLGSQLILQTAQDTFKTDLASVGFVDGDPLFEELEIGFATDIVPPIVLIGREAVPVAQVVNFDLGDAGSAQDGLNRITLAGTAFDKNASSETKAQVVTALIALIDADARFGAVNGADAEQIDVTAAVPGIGFTFAASAPSPDVWLTSISTPNTGLASDLDAWDAERTDWYWVTELSHSAALNISMAAPVAAFARDIVFVSQVDSATDSGATDGNDATRAASFITTSQRTGIAFVPTATDHDLAAHYFRNLPTDPGARTWTNNELRPIDGDTFTSTETAALRSEGVVPGQYWYYENFPTRNFGVSRNARMGDGTKFEFVRDRDSLNNQIIVNVSDAIIDEDKIPYTDAGAGQISAVILATLNSAAADGILDGTTIVVTTLTRAEQAPADVAAGKWLGFTWSATLLGSIDSVDIGGTLFIV